MNVHLLLEGYSYTVLIFKCDFPPNLILGNWWVHQPGPWQELWNYDESWQARIKFGSQCCSYCSCKGNVIHVCNVCSIRFCWTNVWYNASTSISPRMTSGHLLSCSFWWELLLTWDSLILLSGSQVISLSCRHLALVSPVGHRPFPMFLVMHSEWYDAYG